MKVEGKWGLLARQLEALKEEQESAAAPEEAEPLRQRIAQLERQQAAFVEAAAARSPRLPCPPCLEAVRQRFLEAHFASWFDDEVRRVMGDPALLAEVFDDLAPDEAAPARRHQGHRARKH